MYKILQIIMTSNPFLAKTAKPFRLVLCYILFSILCNKQPERWCLGFKLGRKHGLLLPILLQEVPGYLQVIWTSAAKA